jgi:hypothetical protein
LSDIDFESRDTQRRTWNEIRGVMLNAAVEAVARARAALPTEDPREIKIRDGMIMNQLHMIVASVLGETEGKILRYTMTSDEEIVGRRQEYLEAGRVGRAVKT